MVKTPQYQNQIIKICTNSHLTANQIYNKLQKKHPQIGIATVYRNLKRLVKKWKIKKFKGIHKKAIYEADIGLHAHIINNKTGQIKDIDISKDIIKNIDIPKDTKKIDIRLYVD